MPQARRKIPFSGKKKKEQILLKRQVKGTQKFLNPDNDSYDDGETTEDTEVTVRKLMEQPINRAGTSGVVAGGRPKNVNRYNLQFYQESKKELEQLKLEAYKPFDVITPKQREIDASYFAHYDFPVRPKWSYDISKDELERNENRYFREYVDHMQKLNKDHHKELSLFELNLETWRQLWRVLEMSDILLIIVDVRYATLMFPPSLYDYIINVINKNAIVVLNKVDLVDPEAVVAWKHYFHTTYPGLPVVLFASYPTKALKGTARGRVGHKRSMEGVYNIYRECKKITLAEVDLTSWEQKILEDMRDENLFMDDDAIESSVEKPAPTELSGQTDPREHPPPNVKYRDGILTLGCIGFPNVGKSSLINALKGRKVVSVSRTPGHTKHFQTIFLTSNMRLCDCPGLVFPSSTPKHIQVLLGSYPISQLQVPYRSLKLLAEHINLPKLLKLHLPEDFDEWSPAAIADAWALKRGFLTAKAARADRNRAANHLLRMCLAGHQQIILQFYPPGFHDDIKKWQQHPDIEEVRKYQNTQSDEKDVNDDASSVNSESVDTDETTSSYDETNADEEEENDKELTPPKTHNAFALLEDD